MCVAVASCNLGGPWCARAMMCCVARPGEGPHLNGLANLKYGKYRAGLLRSRGPAPSGSVAVL
jgi:hypothetical protein